VGKAWEPAEQQDKGRDSPSDPLFTYVESHYGMDADTGLAAAEVGAESGRAGRSPWVLQAKSQLPHPLQGPGAVPACLHIHVRYPLAWTSVQMHFIVGLGAGFVLEQKKRQLEQGHLRVVDDDLS
jgi:hypothetical protein